MAGASLRVATKLLLLLMSVAVVLGAAEAAVRIRQWIRYGFVAGTDPLLHIDLRTHLREPVPNKVVGNVRINSLGFRGPEIPADKPGGTVRLAFPGASTTFCWDVSGNETTWPHLVWKRLSGAIPQAHFDYINAGVPGYSVATSLKHFELRVKPLRPDVVVIYQATNDLAYATYDVARAQGLLDKRPDMGSSIGQYSLLWFLVEKNLALLARQRHPEAASGKLTVDVRELSRSFERSLTELVKASQKVAEVVAVATFLVKMRPHQPPADQVRFAAMSLYYMPNMTLADLYRGYAEYNRVIREVARLTGALLIDGEDSIPGDDEHFVDSFHFSTAGSEVMAERVAQRLLTAPVFRALVAKESISRSTVSRASND